MSDQQGPERVWLTPWLTLPYHHPLRDSLRVVYEKQPVGDGVEYVRADLHEAAVAEARAGLYEAREPIEGTLVQYVGVHAVDWQPEWGRPTIAFIQADNPAAREESKQVNA